MIPKIRLLDPHCINQIAAGEVIERPLSVIKELVENALDASANKIEVTVEGRGTTFIKVSDNGIGIKPEELSLAIQSHTTSKIDKIQDLDSLDTLGFRGEALATIASVSRLRIVSRTRDQITGTEIKLEAGEVLSFSEIGSPYGTSVTVTDLFYNTPARLKFLSSDATEFGLISDMMGRLALSRPDVSLSLRRPNSMVFNTSGVGNLKDTIASVLGNHTARKLLPISSSEDNVTISGYISPPDLAKSSRHGITFIVNGRVIRSKLLNTALKNGYHTLLAPNMYPTAVIILNLPPTEYDVNVHPAKLEIKFRNERKISQLVTNTVRHSILESRPISKLTVVSDEYKPYPVNQSLNKIPDLSSPVKTNSCEQIRMQYSPKLDYTTPNNNLDTFFVDLRPLGQLYNTYILTTDDKGLYIIDQHAAHERIRYENILKLYQTNETVSQILLIPETINLTLQEEQIILTHFDQLYEMGFVIEHFGERTYFLRGVPLLNNIEAPAKMFRMFIDEIIKSQFSPSIDKLIERWIFVVACRSAIKANDRLSHLEMEELIMKLSHTTNPYSCPHGRPTIIELPKKELDVRFGR